MSAGKEFQTDGAATEKARRASSVRVRGTASSGASDERRVRIGTWVCICDNKRVPSSLLVDRNALMDRYDLKTT